MLPISKNRLDHSASEWQSLISALRPQVFVSVVNGKVTLSGSVRSFLEKRAVEETVAGVAGIRALNNHITVSSSSGPELDNHLTEEIRLALSKQNLSVNGMSEVPYWQFFEL